MIINTHKKLASGREVYVNTETGKEGPLSIIGQTVTPSQRYSKRHRQPLVEKVHTNRKRTPGRNIYYQTIQDKDGKVKTIKHIQETSSALQRKFNLLDYLDRVRRNKGKNDKSKSKDD